MREIKILDHKARHSTKHKIKDFCTDNVNSKDRYYKDQIYQ